jgi:hypothetical protein
MGESSETTWHMTGVAQKTRGDTTAALVRESNVQPLKYSLDLCICQSILISAKFQVSKDQSSVEALNLPVHIRHRLVQMCC